MGRSPSTDENGLQKGPWSPEEDQKLVQYIQKCGHGSWRALPKSAGLNRCGKSCRLRWTNYLRPDIKRGKFSSDEERTILNLHSILGNKWSTIATHLPGRTDNEIKNFWNTHLKKKLIQMGFDPMTHRRRSELYNNLPHLAAFANFREMMAYHHHQQQQQHNPHHQQQQPLEERVVGLQEETVQLATYQYLQFLLQSAAGITSSSCSANNPTDMEAINMLALASSNGPNGVDEETAVWDTYNLDNASCVLGVAASNPTDDNIFFNPLQNLQMTTNFHGLHDPFMNSERNHDSSYLGLLHLGESVLKSPEIDPLLTGALHQTENDVLGNSVYSTSSYWPELLFEEPFYSRNCSNF